MHAVLLKYFSTFKFILGFVVSESWAHDDIDVFIVITLMRSIKFFSS